MSVRRWIGALAVTALLPMAPVDAQRGAPTSGPALSGGPCSGPIRTATARGAVALGGGYRGGGFPGGGFRGGGYPVGGYRGGYRGGGYYGGGYYGGGYYGRGSDFRFGLGGRFGRFNVNLGYGRYHSRYGGYWGSHYPYFGGGFYSPGYVYGGFPFSYVGFGFPYYTGGLGFPYYAGVGVPFNGWFGGYGLYPNVRDYYPAEPAVVQLPPRVIYLDRENDDRYYLSRRDDERFRRDGGRYYLDGRSRPAEDRPDQAPVSPLDAARAQLRVEAAEPGLYLVRWTGRPENVTAVDLQSVDERGQVLGSRLLTEAPFRGLLRVPEKTATVVVSVEQKGGASATLKLPLAEFKAMDRP
jgi:hypothetical protein